MGWLGRVARRPHAAATKRWILPTSLTPLMGLPSGLSSSTPELTSTASERPRGPHPATMPSVTFAGVSPPLKNEVRGDAWRKGDQWNACRHRHSLRHGRRAGYGPGAGVNMGIFYEVEVQTLCPRGMRGAPGRGGRPGRWPPSIPRRFHLHEIAELRPPPLRWQLSRSVAVSLTNSSTGVSEGRRARCQLRRALGCVTARGLGR